MTKTYLCIWNCWEKLIFVHSPYWCFGKIRENAKKHSPHPVWPFWSGFRASPTAGKLDWIRIIANLFDFELDPDYTSLQNLGSGPDLGWVNGKEIAWYFCCEKAAFFKFFGLNFNLDFAFEKSLVGLGLSFKQSGLDLDCKLCQSTHLCFQVSLRGNISGAESARELFIQTLKRLDKSSRLQRKKIGFRYRMFCEWRHKWRCFRHFWPTSSGPAPKLLDGSILRKFLLDIRLKSKPFDTLNNLLGFRVQTLWPKINKISN